MMVPIPAGVTQATKVGQATSENAIVSFTCYLFNLFTFQMSQLRHFYKYKYFMTVMMSGDWERQKGKQNYTALKVVSFAAVIRVVTQCSSPTNGCSLELCIPFPLLLRTSNMHVTVSSCANHISCYIFRQRSRFPRNGSLPRIGQLKERNAELE